MGDSMKITIEIEHPSGPKARPDPTRRFLERILSDLNQLNDKIDAQTATLAEQGAVIAALRSYVNGIEVSLRDLASGEVLSATLQGKVDALLAKLDSNAATLASNTAGAIAAGDGDNAT